MISTNSILKRMKRKELFNEYFIQFGPEELKKVQDVLYKDLVRLIEIFDANGISYTLSGGTCLGAVRHGGFIPWDDDIDINVPRKDFARLKKIVDCDRFEFVHPVNSSVPMTKGIIRLCQSDLKSIFPEKGIESDSARLFFDVYPVDNIPDNVLFRYILGIVTTMLNLSITSNSYLRKYNPMMHALSSESFRIRLMLLFRRSLALFTYPFIHWGKRNKPMIWLNDIYLRLAQKPKKYATVFCGSKRYFGEIMYSFEYEPGEKLKFESSLFYVPKNYDKYLSNLYGDYMVIPKVNDRKIHLKSFDI